MHAYKHKHKKKSNIPLNTHTHTQSWGAKEGFILRVLESGISLALSRVSMAIPCTEIIRGDPCLRRGIQQGQIYISSRVDRPLPLLSPLPSFFILTVHEPPDPFQLPSSKQFQYHTFAASSHNPLSLSHRAPFSVKMVCSLLSNSEASLSRHVSFQLFY